MFQSTHPHGVRRHIEIASFGSWRFNPRTHTGCDVTSGVRQEADSGFNPRTHTGCDLSGRTRAEQSRSFNPRTHTGCDATEYQKTDNHD